MAKSNGITKAVGYLRRSTDKQEASIPDQRTAVQEYADKHGYKILRWYIDDAISGDDTAKRLDFQRMIADAQDKGDFAAILVWDQDRFGRFSPHEASYWTWPLAQAGIQLVTTDKGPIDWSDFTEWLTYSVNQHGKHQFLRDLSRNVTRGQLEAVKNGGWIGGIPFAYRLEGEKKKKRLVQDEPGKAKIVQRIFREFVDQGRSMSNIANRLNADGIPSSGGRGKPWRFDAVKVILENPAYVGDFAGCRASNGKYHTISQGVVAKSTGKRCRKPESEWIIHRDHHPAIIGRDTFAQAQAILAKGKTGRSNHYTPETHPYLLAGLLRCGRCGAPMYGIDNRTKSYECKHTKNGTCEGTTVRENTILEEIAHHLENWLGFDGESLGTAAHYGTLRSDDLPEAFAEIKKLLMPRSKPKQDRMRLQKQADQVKAKLAKARGNLSLLDAENIPAAQECIRQLDRERIDLEQELRQCKPPTEKDINQVVLEVLNNLYALAYMCRSLAKPVDEKWDHYGSLESAAPQAVRRLLSRVSHIVCHTAKQGQRTRTRHEFKRGEIAFTPVGAMTGNVNSHLPG